MENRGPIVAILILDKPAKSDMVVQVIDNGVTATGKLCDNYNFIILMKAMHIWINAFHAKICLV